jgi:hypothetical protein
VRDRENLAHCCIKSLEFWRLRLHSVPRQVRLSFWRLLLFL